MKEKYERIGETESPILYFVEKIVQSDPSQLTNIDLDIMLLKV